MFFLGEDDVVYRCHLGIRARVCSGVYIYIYIYIDYRLDDVHSMLSVVYMVYCRQMEKMDILECC